MFIYFILPRYYMVRWRWTVAVVSKHIIIKKNCCRKKQAHKTAPHNTKQSKPKWSESKKHRVQQKNKANLIWIVYNLCTNMDTIILLLLLFLWCCCSTEIATAAASSLPHTSNHCWMNEQTNCIKCMCALSSKCVSVSGCVCVWESFFLFLLLLHHHRKLVFHKHILSFHQVHLVCLWHTAHTHTHTHTSNTYGTRIYLCARDGYTFKCLGNLMVEWQKWAQPVFLW